MSRFELIWGFFEQRKWRDMFSLLIFVSNTQTGCNCLALYVGITFTSYLRSFLPFLIARPHNKKGDDYCAKLHKSQAKRHDGGQVGIGRNDLG